jgi:hypothetical protein
MDGGECYEAPARLLDISWGGVQIETERTPSPGFVWLSLGGPASTRLVTTQVAWADGRGKVGLAFQGQCPEDFYWSATLNLDFESLFNGTGGHSAKKNSSPRSL